MRDVKKLYQQVILDHSRAPRRSGRLAEATHSASGDNPLCGDRVSVSLQAAGGSIADARCEVRGCAICLASGSLLAEAIVGRELSEAAAFVRRFLAELTAPAAEENARAEEENAAPAGWGHLGALLEARRFPGRRRCASLPWEALERALARRSADPSPSASAAPKPPRDTPV